MDLRDAYLLARSLMDQHGLGDWDLKFDHARQRLGCTEMGIRLGASPQRIRCISLSAELIRLNDERVVRETILHECAHAIAGTQARHGAAWQRVASALGCSPTATYRREGLTEPVREYVGTCPKCGLEIQRYRRMAGACRVCDRAGHGEQVIVWRRVRIAPRQAPAVDPHQLPLDL